jgi:hypothetical protein
MTFPGASKQTGIPNHSLETVTKICTIHTFAYSMSGIMSIITVRL